MSASTTDRAFSEAPGAEGTLFVINLCASTSPLALVHPSNPELKRYTFFVTRQREDGRERFRLHMGYFQSQGDAEHLLAAVRDVYPAAWAGPAPTSGGAPRRPRAVAARPAAPPPQKVAPEVQAPAPVRAPPPKVQAPPPKVQAPPPAPAAAPAPVRVSAPPPAAAPRTRSAPPAPPLDAMSNVRSVLAQLSDETPAGTASPKVARPASPAPPAPQPPVLQPPVLQPPVVQSPAPAPKAAPPASPAAGSLSATQTLRLLEESKTSARAAEPEEPDDGSVRVVTPEDTQTLRDIRLDRDSNAPPCYAVQLLWSVAPINAADHPHLAIFEAYTLYHAEGSRQGRRWYGLRLGFFRDPNAATQVAYYVRSDYPTVAVVPVAQKERDHAQGRPESDGKSAAPSPVPMTPPALTPHSGPLAARAVPPAHSAPRAATPVQATQKTQPQPALKVPALKVPPPTPPQPRPAPKAAPGKAAPGKPPGSAAPNSGMEGFELLEDDRPPPIKRDVGDSDPDATLPERQEKPIKVRPKGPEGKPIPPRATGKPSGKRVVVRKTGDVGRVTPGASTPLDETFEILGASTLTLDESHEVINDDKVRKKDDRKDDKKKKPEGSGGRLSRLLNRLGS